MYGIYNVPADAMIGFITRASLPCSPHPPYSRPVINTYEQVLSNVPPSDQLWSSIPTTDQLNPTNDQLSHITDQQSLPMITCP